MFKEIGFVVYAVTDMPKAKAFYEGILGLTPSDEYKDSTSWVEYNIGPTTLAIGCSPDWKPSIDGAVAALEAIDFDTTIEHLKSHQVSFKMDAMDFPTCKMAVIKDPDNNNILIHQRKSK